MIKMPNSDFLRDRHILSFEIYLWGKGFVNKSFKIQCRKNQFNHVRLGE